MPKSADGISTGMLMAALVHLGLIGAIALGVNWKASTPAGVDAELWASVPQIAAQRDVAPEPPRPTPRVEPKPEPRPEPKPKAEPVSKPQPDPQIAVEKAKQDKLKKKLEEDKREKEKLEKEEREEKEKLEKKKAQDEKAKLAKAEAERQKKLDDLRDKNLARLKEMMGADQGSPGGTATQTAGPSAGWAGRVVARVRPNFVYTDAIRGDPAIEVELKLAPDGTIVSRKLTKSSGDARLDDAILRAIDKTETLPRDTDGRVPTSVEIVFRPGKF